MRLTAGQVKALRAIERGGTASDWNCGWFAEWFNAEERCREEHPIQRRTIHALERLGAVERCDSILNEVQRSCGVVACRLTAAGRQALQQRPAAAGGSDAQTR